MKIIEKDLAILEYLQKHNLMNPYRKAKQKLEKGLQNSVQIKKRNPKHLGIYQFRITKKYRAFAIKQHNNLVVFKISDHQ